MQQRRFWCESLDRLLLAVDGLAFDEDRPKQDAETLGVWKRGARAARGDVLIEKAVNPDRIEEVVDDRQGADPLRLEIERLLLRHRGRERNRGSEEYVVAEN